MENWIATLLKLGRPGGALSVLAAVGIMVVVVLDYLATGAFFLALPPLALALFVMGVALLIWGSEGRELKIKDNAPPPAELVRRLYIEERPFHVCTRCKRVAEGKMCDKCGSRADCLLIDDEDDIKMALSSMS